MRERGILMTSQNVRWILAGTKTQTRRVVKTVELQRADDIEPHESYPGEWSPWIDGERRATIECPYGAPGDRLWVRETWRTHSTKHDKIRPRDLSPHGDVVIHYDASMQFVAPFLGKGRPSMFMPRWASRITLEITEVRVERLQEISDADCVAEGVERVVAGDGWRRYADSRSELAGLPPCATARDSYRSLWESINGAGSWDVNPWVWALTFRRINDA